MTYNRYNEDFSRFDPRDIDIVVKQFSLYQIIRRLEQNEIMLDNYFQRRNDLWDTVKQSRFIESILIRIPLPSFYFAEVGGNNHDSIWQVIDGLQRISTLRNFFVEKTLTLNGLEFLPEYNGYSINSMPVELIRRIEDSYITAHIIGTNTPDQIKYIIFDRINTGGLKLSSQEMRHALYQGVAVDFLQRLVDKEMFKQATDFSISPRRMLDQEYVNRFVAFYLNLDSYDGHMEAFLNQALEDLKATDENKRFQIEDGFDKAMHFSFHVFRENAFRKNVNMINKRPAINKALFECVAVNFAKANPITLERIRLQRHRFLDQFRVLLNETMFYESITSGTSKRDKVIYRFRKIDELISYFNND